MSFFLLNIAGFLLDLLPFSMLLFQPFGDEYLRISRRHMYMVYGIGAAVLSVGCPFFVRWMDYSGLAFCIAVILLFILIRDAFTKRLVAVLAAVFYLETQSLIVLVAEMIRSLFHNVPLKTIYEDLDFPYEGFNVTVRVIVTGIFFPLMLVFERKILKPYLRIVKKSQMWRQIIFVILIFAVDLMSISFYFAYFMESVDTFWFFFPIGILLLLGMCILFALIFRVALSRTREGESHRQLELMQEGFKNIQRDMERSRELYHDLRQLLRQLYSVSEEHQIKELEPYIQKIVSLTKHTDTVFCENRCLNALFQYYSGVANGKQIPISISAVCAELPVKETDLTLLFANALENSIRAAEEYRGRTGREPKITVVVGIVANYLAIQLTNPCAEVRYAPGVSGRSVQEFLTAESFVSIHEDGGHGLKRIGIIAEKYNGTAGFLYDEKKSRWTTRISLSIPRRS